MDIEQRTGTAVEEASREDEHPAGKDDEIELQWNEDAEQIFFQSTARSRIVSISNGSDKDRDPGIPGSLRGSGFRIVTDHSRNLRGERAAGICVDERLEIRALARGKDGDTAWSR
jgi:hypothetical protein